jgi:hypothetical protein
MLFWYCTLIKTGLNLRLSDKGVYQSTLLIIGCPLVETAVIVGFKFVTDNVTLSTKKENVIVYISLASSL